MQGTIRPTTQHRIPKELNSLKPVPVCIDRLVTKPAGNVLLPKRSRWSIQKAAVLSH